MARDLDIAHAVAEVSPAAEVVLTGPRRPVLLVPRRPGGGIAPSVAPGNPDLGLFLPYTPVHELLFGAGAHGDGPAVLVMTSGNLSGEPLVTDDAEALTRLAGLADAWLAHDRAIVVPCDDSVARWVGGAELPIRRARGYAPLPVALPFEVEPTLAVGADLKTTCCLAEGRYAWLSQHLGDMDDVATLASLTTSEAHLRLLTGVEPTRLVADAHPSYRSAAWARRHAETLGGRPVVTVQHHHAHVASVMAEHGLAADRTVIGVALDGTGYGTDGAVWGGEVLLAGYKGFQRAGHLGYVPLAGGDASVERPYRMALAHLRAAGVAWDDDLAPVAACPDDERRVLAHQLETGFGCVPTSSAGRLFDAVAALLGVRQTVDFEAQAAIELEALARGADPDATPYRFGVADGVADPAPVVRAVVDDLRAGTPPPVVSARFHAAVVGVVADLARRTRERSGVETVVLGGGVFQNTVLLTGVTAALDGDGFEVLRPRLLPPNDGGLALGQVVVAAAGS